MLFAINDISYVGEGVNIFIDSIFSLLPKSNFAYIVFLSVKNYCGHDTKVCHADDS